MPIQLIDGDRSSRYPKTDEIQEEGVLFLNTTNIEQNMLNLNDANFITEDKYSTIRKGRLKPSDIIMVTRGSIGKLAIFNCGYSQGLINAQMLIFRADNKTLDQKYLFYTLSSEHIQQKIKNFASGAAQPQIPIKDLQEIEISYPPLPTQRKIASILSAYDDLIENNIRRIKILEEMAQAIYKEWFVNFRFPGHEKVKMVNSELGNIPEGWEVKEASKMCSKIVDGTHDTPKPTNEGYYLVTGKHIVNGFIDFSKCYFISPEDHEKVMKRSKPENGDIIFSNIGTLGSTVYVYENFEFSIKNVALFKPLKSYYSPFLYLYLVSANTLELMNQRSFGTSQKFFSLEFLRNMKMVSPTDAILVKFHNLIEPIIKERSLLRKKNIHLHRTRELLLPKLISGEIDLEDLKIEVDLDEQAI